MAINQTVENIEKYSKMNRFSFNNPKITTNTIVPWNLVTKY